ncbi:MAG: GGDEF domain-containing protein [Treponema sp.]|jgi:diguanylate cyclase (GGDEF)-like protein|nr:GGDEF domain-containing protein [Treponema sp.]
MDNLELKALEHIRGLLRGNSIPKLEGELAEQPLLGEIHEDLKTIREILLSFSAGDFSPAIRIRGIIPGCLKALQAHLRHMIWQVQMVEKGDFTQRVHFMGEFSTAFNSMVQQMDKTLSVLKQKEEKLQSEVTRSFSAMEALQESEARFKFLASHDPLTGALNRVSFMDRVIMETERACGEPFCIAIMDIDHFKNFNDTYGHMAGDETLRHVVKVMSAGLRKHDFLGRYGGEEFTFFFAGAGETTGMAIAERLRAALETSPVKLEYGDVRVTASFGVAESGEETFFKDREENTEDLSGKKSGIQGLINNADLAMYSAKRSGRNRVIAYRPELRGVSGAGELTGLVTA